MRVRVRVRVRVRMRLRIRVRVRVRVRVSALLRIVHNVQTLTWAVPGATTAVGLTAIGVVGLGASLEASLGANSGANLMACLEACLEACCLGADLLSAWDFG